MQLTNQDFINLLCNSKIEFKDEAKCKVIIDSGMSNDRLFIYYDALNEVFVFFDVYINNIKLVPTDYQIKVTTEYINRNR